MKPNFTCTKVSWVIFSNKVTECHREIKVEKWSKSCHRLKRRLVVKTARHPHYFIWFIKVVLCLGNAAPSILIYHCPIEIVICYMFSQIAVHKNLLNDIQCVFNYGWASSGEDCLMYLEQNQTNNMNHHQSTLIDPVDAWWGEM